MRREVFPDTFRNFQKVSVNQQIALSETFRNFLRVSVEQQIIVFQKITETPRNSQKVSVGTERTLECPESFWKFQ